MKSTALTLVWLCFGLSLGLRAQSQAQPQGLEPEWDIQRTLEAISAHAKRLLPLLDEIDPQSWVSKGAPETYVTQWNNAKVQAKALATTALALSKQPEKLSAGLETFFRIQALNSMLGSLGEGLRKYQNPALADLVAGVAGESGAHRAKFQQYLVDLASQKEQEFQIMDREAQRCRGMLSRQAPKPVVKKTETK